MQKNVEKMSINYSPNFNSKKRSRSMIKYLIYHYTGMKSEIAAIKKLTNLNSKVSCHYLIKFNGEIVRIVPDLYVAWHAGISSWKNVKFLNKYSIGIEISNPGHNYQYVNFTKKQINSVLKLSKFLKKKYKIKSKFILGHSDISPDRKKDPGEKFPWQILSNHEIGTWHNLSKEELFKYRNIKLDKFEKNTFIKNLYKIGYSKDLKNKNIQYSKILTISFQRRFRKELINGIIDKECLKISKNLVKKFL